jgi:hypothetical protein
MAHPEWPTLKPAPQRIVILRALQLGDLLVAIPAWRHHPRTGHRRRPHFAIQGATYMQRLKILIWHIHGTYLHAITQLDHEWYLPTRLGAPEGYGGRGRTFDWPAWVREVPAEAVRDLDLDLIIYQSPQNYFTDRQEILSDAQQRLPGIYIEHNTPRPHPWESRHPVADEDVLLVHVTQYLVRSGSPAGRDAPFAGRTGGRACDGCARPRASIGTLWHGSLQT